MILIILSTIWAGNSEMTMKMSSKSKPSIHLSIQNGQIKLSDGNDGTSTWILQKHENQPGILTYTITSANEHEKILIRGKNGELEIGSAKDHEDTWKIENLFPDDPNKPFYKISMGSQCISFHDEKWHLEECKDNSEDQILIFETEELPNGSVTTQGELNMGHASFSSSKPTEHIHTKFGTEPDTAIITTSKTFASPVNGFMDVVETGSATISNIQQADDKNVFTGAQSIESSDIDQSTKSTFIETDITVPIKYETGYVEETKTVTTTVTEKATLTSSVIQTTTITLSNTINFTRTSAITATCTATKTAEPIRSRPSKRAIMDECCEEVSFEEEKPKRKRKRPDMFNDAIKNVSNFVQKNNNPCKDVCDDETSSSEDYDELSDIVDDIQQIGEFECKDLMDDIEVPEIFRPKKSRRSRKTVKTPVKMVKQPNNPVAVQPQQGQQQSVVYVQAQQPYNYSQPQPQYQYQGMAQQNGYPPNVTTRIVCNPITTGC